MIQAIGYIRRSTDRQEESLDQQRAKLEAFARQQGWKLAHVYADDAVSGSEMERPGLSHLLASVQSRDDIGAVITWDRNRLARPNARTVSGTKLTHRLHRSPSGPGRPQTTKPVPDTLPAVSSGATPPTPPASASD